MERSVREILKDQAVWDVWREMPSDSKEKYQAYLCSREWALLRNQVMERCGGICERCRVNKADAVHHLHYGNKYREAPEDLRAVCNGCHEYTHGKSDIDPRAAYYAGDRPLTGIGPGEAFGNDSLVTCPYCGSENCHMAEPSTSGSTATNANQGVLRVPMWCECSCRWEMVFEGHKGTLRAYVTNWSDHA